MIWSFGRSLFNFGDSTTVVLSKFMSIEVTFQEGYMPMLDFN